MTYALIAILTFAACLAIVYQPSGNVGGYRPDGPPRKPPALPKVWSRDE